MADFVPHKAPEVAPKRPTEKVLINWNLTKWLDSDETVSSLDSVSVSPTGSLTFSQLGASGQVASAIAEKNASANEGGLAGTTYVCTAKVTTSKGQVLELDGTVDVV